MSDLISRSELKKEIKGIYINVGFVRSGKEIFAKFMDSYKELMLEVIDNQPTAYDIDKVIEELESDERHTFDGCINKRYAIEIVKQGGVSDDVCEWKKCSSGSVDFYVYSSKCFTKNLKEIGTTTNFIDDFKYCPYCGKKIKVVK